MKATAAIFSVLALSFAAAVGDAQETMKGEVVTLDEASEKIGIRLNGTSGPAI